MLTVLTSILTAFSVALYSFFKWHHKYWQQEKLPYLPPSIPFGNFGAFIRMKISNGHQFQKIYRHFKSLGHVHGGVYFIASPAYVPIDTEIIKSILSSNSHHFTNKDDYTNEEDQPISANLFTVGGEKWRSQRRISTAAFTTRRLKLMVNSLTEFKKPLHHKLEECAKNETPLDIKETTTNFATDIIVSVMFGLESNCLTYPDGEFGIFVKRLIKPTFKNLVKSIFLIFFKELSRKLRLVVLPKYISDFFTKAIIDEISRRENTGIVRDDFLDLLRIGKSASDKVGVDSVRINEIISMSFGLFLGGLLTSSKTIYFCLFELALNQEIQDKVREEIRVVLGKHGEDITYQSLEDMKYLKQVVDETLRKYPPIPTIDRKCSKDFEVPGTDFVLKSGTTVVVSTLGLHTDPEYYPEPEKFDPDRFSDANVGDIKPFSYLPFSAGPRKCLGQRFGIMETKLGLVTLLKDFRYKLNKKSSPDLEFTENFILTAKSEILLDVEELKNISC